MDSVCMRCPADFIRTGGPGSRSSLLENIEFRDVVHKLNQALLASDRRPCAVRIIFLELDAMAHLQTINR